MVKVEEEVNSAPTNIPRISVADLEDKWVKSGLEMLPPEQKDASKGANQPTSLVSALFGEESGNNKTGRGFKTVEELEAFFARFEGE